MNIPQEQIDELIRLVGWHLRSFRNRPDWDDILSIGYVGMWKNVVRWQKNPRYALRTVALNGAMWAVLSYTEKSKRVWESECPLEPERTNEEGESFTPEFLMLPDFVPELLEQMDGPDVLSVLDEQERQILIQYHVDGLTLLEVANAHGRNSKTWGFNNVRAAEKKLRAYSQEISSDCRS